MRGLSNAITGHLFSILSEELSGLNTRVSAATRAYAFALPEIREILVQNAAPELVEKTSLGKYPSVLIYCDKMANTLKEKFRCFSGSARACIEVRCSQDRIEHLEKRLQAYVDVLCDLLEQTRGEWGEGLMYPGGYEVTYGSVKSGGSHFLQIAKVTLEVEISR